MIQRIENKVVQVQAMGFVSKIGIGMAFLVLFSQCNNSKASRQPETPGLEAKADSLATVPPPVVKPVGYDTSHYLQLISQLSRNQQSTPWPFPEVFPKAGAIFPFKRIVAYYGNLYSTRMGILGALPPDEMLDKLQQETINWEKADSTTPVLPALHYIAVTAQREPGKNKKYRLRMPFKEIDKVMEIASRIDAAVFLDIQVGHSTLQEEIPALKEYLKNPNVHLGIDPEYSMKGGEVPGRKVGTFDADDINYATEYLATLVKEYDLPPKVLVVHRFTKGMVTNASQIKIIPEVQVVINMDGFGNKAKKLDSYKIAVIREPVQYAGFKIFYKNDAERSESKRTMQPEEVLALHPVPMYIQYQ
ncbi:MAG TPA: hypothetical protein VGK46_05825 [Saprospiraceae bacterium]